MKKRYLTAVFALFPFIFACSDGSKETTQSEPATSETKIEMPDMTEKKDEANMSSGVTILSPKDGDKVSPNFSVEYNVIASETGDHVHLDMDGGKPNVLKEMKGSFNFEGVAPGEHTVNIIENSSGHTPTGSKASIKVTVE